MPAYYIDSGELHTKIFAETPHKACLKAFSKALEEKDEWYFGLIATIDERGSDKLEGDTVVAITSMILLELGEEDRVITDTAYIDEVLKKYGEEDNDKFRQFLEGRPIDNEDVAHFEDFYYDTDDDFDYPNNDDYEGGIDW